MSAHVITIAQQKGGAGKTTFAAHLAVAWAQRGLRVALIDIDPQGSLTHWHKVRAEAFGEGYTGLSFTGVTGWRVGSEISRLKPKYDLIIIDSPPHTETEARSAIRSADMVIVPIQPSPNDLWATKATIDIALNDKVPLKLVLNRVTANSKLAKTIADQLKGLSKNMLGNRVLFASAMMDGKGVTEVAPYSPAAKEIKALAEEILEQVAPEMAEESEPKAERKKRAGKGGK